MKYIVILLTILFIFDVSFGLEYNKHGRYNPNNDFLLHESGVNPSIPKRDNAATQDVNLPSPTPQNTNQNSGNRDYLAQFPQLGPIKPSQNSGKRDYVAQFPILGPPTASPSTQNGGKRDYVAPNNQNSGKRDYVAPVPQKPLPTVAPSQTTIHNNVNIRNPQNTNGKRDYVAPQLPTVKPTQGSGQQSTGKVKDLINFYGGKNQNAGQGVPSYSSILQNSGNKITQSPTAAPGPKITHTTSATSMLPTKPLSFSDIVSGSNKPSPQPVPTTATPSTKRPNSPAPRPGSPGLPSSYVPNRNNNQPNNANRVTDAELQVLSEELLRKDVNNAAKHITINYQQKTTSQSLEDKAPNPLFTVSPDAWNIPTIQKFIPLLDNYERDTLVNEHVTPQERTEENTFMDAIMSTTVIRHLMNFLKDKGYVTPDPRQQRDFLKQLWFSLYSRGQGKIGSSGFEHVFVSELKNGQVSGSHNWIYFSREEAANRANYLGYLKYVQLGDKGAVLKYNFNQQGVHKPVNSMFIGTSPELEIALYTLCFLSRPDTECKLKLANNDIEITSFTWRYRSKNLIGSAYPVIPVAF